MSSRAASRCPAWTAVSVSTCRMTSRRLSRRQRPARLDGRHTSSWRTPWPSLSVRGSRPCRRRRHHLLVRGARLRHTRCPRPTARDATGARGRSGQAAGLGPRGRRHRLGTRHRLGSGQEDAVHVDAGDQACGWVMLTIQVMPNWSTQEPNSSPHICFSRGTETVPPSDSCSQ